MTDIVRHHRENIVHLAAPCIESATVDAYLAHNGFGEQDKTCLETYLAASIFIAFGEAARDVRAGHDVEITMNHLTFGVGRRHPPLRDRSLHHSFLENGTLEHRIGRAALRSYLRLLGCGWKPWHVMVMSSQCTEDELRTLGRQIDPAINSESGTAAAIVALANTAEVRAYQAFDRYAAVQQSNRDFEREMRTRLMRGLKY